MSGFDSGADMDEVEKIVETMKRKYREEGMEFEEVSGSLRELRGIIAGDTYSKADIDSRDDLEAFDSQIAQKIGSFYLASKEWIKPLFELLKKFPLSSELGYYLYSANMPYSANQYLAITSAVVLISGLVFFIAGLFLGTVLSLSTGNIFMVSLLPFILGGVFALIAAFGMILIPKQAAVARGNACSLELPFALRHMATELRAGIGLYKTIQAVTSTDYGVLSEEFARTINEIEEGTDTAVALKHLSMRTQSKPLKTAVNHIVRAMRTGGNLSQIMNEIAGDVSDDLKTKINSFSQQMNFVSVIFIFICIVMPVAIMILGAIRNSPMGSSGQGLFNAVPLTPTVMVIFYLVIMPVIFVGMNLLVYVTQPKM